MFHLTDDSGLQVNKDGSGDMLSGSGLTEEGVEGVVSTSTRLVTGHLSVRLDPMLQAVQLPTGITHLDSGLAHMHGNTLTLKERRYKTSTTWKLESK